MESNYADPIAGKLAYIASMGVLILMANRHIKKSISKTPNLVNTRDDFVAKIDFNIPASTAASSPDNENLIYQSIKFLKNIVDSPGSYFTNPYVGKVLRINLKRIIDSVLETHDEIKEQLELKAKRVKQFPDRKLTEMIEGFSGVLYINAKYGFLSKAIAMGAAYNPNKGDIIINLIFSNFIFDMFEKNASEKDQKETFAYTINWSQNAIKQIKTGMTHELVHATQQDEFQEKTGIMSTIKGMINPVKQLLKNNLKNFDDIDEKFFPILKRFQEMLEQHINESIGGIFSSASKLNDYNLVNVTNSMSDPWSGIKKLYDKSKSKEENREIYKLSVAITYFSILADIFSPQEVEAYIRGDYTKMKKIVNAPGGARERDPDIRSAIRGEYSRFVANRYCSVFNVDTVPEWVQILVEEISNISLSDLWIDAYQGYMKVYDSIYNVQ